VRTRLSRLTAFLPLPHFLQRRPDETGPMSAGGGGSLASQAQMTFSNFSHVAAGGATVEHAATAIQKAAAVVTAAAVLGGGGIVAKETRTAPGDRPVEAKRAVAAPAMAQRQAGTVRLVTPLTAPLAPTPAPPLVAVLSVPAALLTSLPLAIIPPVEPSTTPKDSPAASPPAPATPEPAAAPSTEAPADTAAPDPPAKDPKEEGPTGGASSTPSGAGQVGIEFTSPDPNEPVGDIVAAAPEPAPPVPADPPPDTGGGGGSDQLACAPPAPAGCETTETAPVPY
jgi:hypothetical protein